MSPHDEHIKRIDAVNAAKTRSEHTLAAAELAGFRDGLEVAGVRLSYIACDETQFARGHQDRPMCCGVFLDWEPEEEDD